jgi:para-aminobenzoate synthetase component 1
MMPAMPAPAHAGPVTRPTTQARSRPTVRLERWPALDGIAPMDAAEALRGLPGVALLETARPGRRARWSYLLAEPLEVVETASPGREPFADARALLARLDPLPTPSAGAALGADPALGAGPDLGRPPFLGGLVGFLGYDVGGRLERLPHRVADDLDVPELRLGLYDRVVAWDRRTGRAWLGGRALDGDAVALDRRLAGLRGLLEEMLLGPIPTVALADVPELGFTSSLDREAYLGAVESIRASIARGELYQANLTRRLETPFAADPWPLYRRLRTGDPALFSAYLDLGPGAGGAPRALISASPEPFLSLTNGGLATTDPIKGTRPRGRTPEIDRDLARELLCSAKDRAENVMIVDVLRNDLGRVCLPGTVRVPRLCRLERTAAVQHLVSTVTGQLRSDADAFDLLAATFPGGSITGAPKLRAIELLDAIEPVRRGPYTGALLWIGADGAMGSSILIRTLVADGRRLTLHVGGGITWKSDPAAEWDETVAKARGPLSAIGATEVA